MSPPKEDVPVHQQPTDTEMKERDADKAKTSKPDAPVTPAKREPHKNVDNVPPKTGFDDTKSKSTGLASKTDTEMTEAPIAPLEKHQASFSAIKEALFSDLPPESAAQQILQVTASHPDRDRFLSSVLHSVLPNVPLESALRVIDVSSHLPYAARSTISLIETLTKTVTTSTLSTLLPLLQPHINTMRTRPKSDIPLIKLLRSFISRDPHAANPVLAGRLKLLIASALPAWHASGMNHRGQYNTHVLPPVPTPADPALARALTAFTDACRYPPGCEQPAGWASARDGLRILLDAFDVGKLTEIQTRICVQATMLFQHLEFDGGSFGKSLFAGGEGVGLRRRVWDRLDAGFKRFFAVLLQRERRWVRWKKTKEHAKAPKVEIRKVFKRRVIQKQSGSLFGTVNMGLAKPSWKTVRERASGGGVRTLIEELKEDKEEAEEDKRKGDGKYVWRGLRSLCEENVCLMAKVADNEGEVDLERILSEEVGG